MAVGAREGGESVFDDTTAIQVAEVRDAATDALLARFVVARLAISFAGPLGLSSSKVPLVRTYFADSLDVAGFQDPAQVCGKAFSIRAALLRGEVDRGLRGLEIAFQGVENRLGPFDLSRCRF